MQYDPAIAGTFLEKGLNVQYDLSQADVIVSLDADFLSGASYPGFHKLVRDYADRRKQPENGMNRLYAVESSTTTTGMKAEHRLGLRASEIPAFAAALAQAVGVPGVNAPAYAWTAEQQKFLAALAKDLKANAGKSVVIPGLYQDPSVAALALAINNALGNVGKTVIVGSEPAIPLPSDQLGDFKALVADLNAGKVDWLVILNANPIYDAPADLDFADAFNKANIVAHLGSHYDETGQQSHWHIPAAHYLESWSDARAYDGTVSIVQPMIDPLYGGHTAHHVFQTLLNEPMAEPVRCGARDVEDRRSRAISKPAGARRCTMDGLRTRRTPTAQAQATALDVAFTAQFPRPRQRIRSKSSSAPIRMFTTAAGTTWAGCRSCPSR